ncbi:unnamed protein product, partial [Schistosoma mattheei]
TGCVHLYESTKHKTPDDSFFINPITKQHLRCNLIIDSKSATHQVSSSEFSAQESVKNLNLICSAYSKDLQSEISPSNFGENRYLNCIISLSFVRSGLTSSSSVLLRNVSPVIPENLCCSSSIDTQDVATSSVQNTFPKKWGDGYFRSITVWYAILPMVVDQTSRLDKTSAGVDLETQSEKVLVEDVSQETVSITISESLTDGTDASTTTNSQSTNHENKSETLQTFTRCKSPTNNNNSLSSSSNATSIEYSQTSSPGDSGRRRLVPDFNIDDLLLISELGRGNGGIVTKLQHKSSGTFLIRKTFELDVKTTTRAQIVRDLQVLWECISPHIIEFHGAIHSECLISIYMEYMDVGGMDLLLKMVGRFPEPIIIHIADSVVSGLLYLWQELHMFHRNLKPSNILINRAGTIKLCDFVVSLQLSEYVASGFLGFSTYIAPERLAGRLNLDVYDIFDLI